jgi:hypothetical protein
MQDTQTVTIDNIKFDGESQEDGWQHRRWRYDLYVGDEPLYLNSPYRTGMALDEPSESDILAGLAADLSSTAGYTDWLDWAEDLDGLRDAESARKSREAFRTIETLRTLLTEHGVDAEAFTGAHTE